MKRLITHLLVFLCLGLMFSTSVTAETKWITKKNSKTSKIKTLEQMYVDGLLTRNECIKAKKKILKSQSIPGCKQVETEEETATYVTKKKEKLDNELRSTWENYPFNKKFYTFRTAQDYFKNKKLTDLVYLSSKTGEGKSHWNDKYPNWSEANYKKYKAWSEGSDGAWSWSTSPSSQLDAIKQSITRCNSYTSRNDCVVVKAQDKVLTYKQQGSWLELVSGKTTLAVKLIKEKSSSETYIAKKEKKKKKEEKKLITKKKKSKPIISGVYRGTTGVGNNVRPLFVQLNTDDKGVVSGHYTYGSGDQLYGGPLYNGKFQNGILKIYWTEGDTKGWSKVKFDKRFEKFTAEWGFKEGVKEDGIWQAKKEITQTQIASTKKEKKKKVEKYVPDDEDIDNIKPKIEIASSFTFKEPEYTLKGKVTDKGGSEKVYLFIQKGEGKERRVKLKNGKFSRARFSYDDEEIKLIARDEYANETVKVIKIKIAIEEETEVASVYDELEPIVKGIRDNKRVALIIGVETYTNTPVKALYAKNDAEKFKNFANRSLGIRASNIKVLIDSTAKRLDAVEALKLWLPKKITPNESELFVFFSGHGYPSQEEGLHLIPQDGDPRLLEESALSHRYVIDQIIKTKPKSVTMFLDACYSGQSRTDEVLIAGLKQIKHVDDNEDIPANFSIFSSSKSSQVSATIEQAEHGIFSYYLMEGLTGKADLNKDRQITNIELFVYLQDKVSDEAFKQNRDQNPILTSQNPDQILMKY